MLDSIVTSGSGGGQNVVPRLTERVGQGVDDLTASLDQSLGTAPIGPRQAIEDIAAKSKDARDAAYKASDAKTINWASPAGREMMDVFKRMDPADLRDGIELANKILRNEKKPIINVVPSRVSRGGWKVSTLSSARSATSTRGASESSRRRRRCHGFTPVRRGTCRAVFGTPCQSMASRSTSAATRSPRPRRSGSGPNS
jgi:hypothetical protein